MNFKTILFETILAARQAYDTLQPLIDIDLDCNALTYDIRDEELVKWLVRDYCLDGERAFYIYPKSKLNLGLLVDDDPNLTMLLAEYLEYSLNIQAIQAESAEAGWRSYCLYNPELVISGIAMETIDSGYSFLQQVREQNPAQLFIVLSSQMRFPAKKDRAIELGANACFGKPFEPQELLMTIRGFFEHF